MKEFISNIEPEVYDQEIYPRLIMGVNAGQMTLDGDLLIVMNPESKFYPLIEDVVETIKKPQHLFQRKLL